MSLRNILILFIASFLCIIFSINHFCHKFVDYKVNTFFVAQKLKTGDLKTIKNEYYSPKSKYITENQRLVFSLTCSLCILVIILFAKPLEAYIVMIFFLIFYFITYKLLINHGIYTSLFSPILSILSVPFFAGTYKRVFKNDVNIRMQKLLGKYISTDISDKLLKNIDSVQLGGKKADISVMFADIRGFTSISETHSAEEVSILLNEYFTEIEPIIHKYGGVINKFIGDAVLVIFGEPSGDKEHAKNSVKCAYELKERVKKIQERWLNEGKPKIDIGIAINTGEAFIGNVGTVNRFEYTVIGDTVNIASRIEGYNAIYKTHILISQNTYNKISHAVDVIKIREVAIKGKANKINIYEVLRITE